MPQLFALNIRNSKNMHTAYKKFKFSEMCRRCTFVSVLFNDDVSLTDHIAQATDQ